MAIFIESEIWPNFINEINRKEIPLILINARMTKKTFLKWNNLKNFSKSIFNKFNLTLSQNKETMFFLKKLGSKNIKNFGNLKFSENKSIKYNNIKSINGITNFDIGVPSKILFDKGIKEYAYNWREGGKFSLEKIN